MAKPDALSPLLAALRALTTWLDATRVPGMIIGGAAASLLGRPRITGDVDAIVILDEDRWGDFIDAAAGFGIEPRLPDALAFARGSQVFLLRHRDSGIDIDVAVGSLPFEREAVRQRQRVSIAGVRLPLPTPEDLIIMKAVAQRARDIADIESVVAAHPRLDVARIRRWLRAFATALDQPEILATVETILAARSRVRRRRRPAKH